MLKGPKGTLFGKSASGGVINIVTARPTKDFSLAAEALGAENGEYQGRVTVSGLLTAKLGARATFTYQTDVNFSLKPDPLTVQRGYGILDASVRVSDRDDRYILSVFSRNLTDKFYRSSILQDFTSLTDAQAQQRIPRNSERRFGVSVRVNVGER